MFLFIGVASAGENSTDESSDIGDLINDADNNGNIKLDEKTYDIICENESGTKHILINKTLTIEGVNGTVIDGHNNTLYLDCPEPVKKEGNIVFVGYKDAYQVKNIGKNIVFKDITFKDIRILSWHRMIFNNCTFANTNYAGYELDDTFDNCIFNESCIKPCVLLGYRNSSSLTVSGCEFYNSSIKSLSIATTTYLHLVGGDRYMIINNINLTDSRLYNSKITTDYNNMTMSKSELNNVSFDCHSTVMKIDLCELNSPEIRLSMSQMMVENSNITNSRISTYAGYFSRGCEIYLKDSVLNNTEIKMLPNSIHSQKSEFTSVDSIIENGQINTTDTIVSIIGNELINTHLELFFSSLKMNNSTFHNEGNVKDAIKTKTSTEKVLDDGKSVTCLVKTNYAVVNSYLVNSTGNYSIDNKEVGMDTLHRIYVSNKKSYYYGDRLTIKLLNYKGKPVAGRTVYVEDLKTYDIYKVKTNKNGIAVFKLKNTGKKYYNIYYTSPGFTYRDIDYGKTVNLKVNKIKTIVKAPKVTNKFKKSKYFKVSVKNKATKKAISNIKVKIKVYTGKKYKTFTAKTDKKGIAKINTKFLKKGVHKVIVSSGNKNVKISAKSAIKIKR